MINYWVSLYDYSSTRQTSVDKDVLRFELTRTKPQRAETSFEACLVRSYLLNVICFHISFSKNVFYKLYFCQIKICNSFYSFFYLFSITDIKTLLSCFQNTLPRSDKHFIMYSFIFGILLYRHYDIIKKICSNANRFSCIISFSNSLTFNFVKVCTPSKKSFWFFFCIY